MLLLEARAIAMEAEGTTVGEMDRKEHGDKWAEKEQKKLEQEGDEKDHRQ